MASCHVVSFNIYCFCMVDDCRELVIHFDKGCLDLTLVEYEKVIIHVHLYCSIVVHMGGVVEELHCEAGTSMEECAVCSVCPHTDIFRVKIFVAIGQIRPKAIFGLQDLILIDLFV